jgi:glycosyltransferase involved in cell wall biosynthesis
MTLDRLVSIGIPIRNGERTIAGVVASAQAQDHENLEIVISDNASTDGTEDLCRELAAADPRIVYVRRPENIGLVPNFVEAMKDARGTWFRWLGDGDRLDPTYVSRCLAVAESDPRLVLVSTQIAYKLVDGTVTSGEYRGTALASQDPATRFAEMLRMLTSGYTLLDPLYSFLRRDVMAAVPFRRVLRGDEVYAARMALAGPWAHIPEVLAQRGWEHDRMSTLAARLGIPRWQVPLAREIQAYELWLGACDASLNYNERQRAGTAIARLYGRRIAQTAQRAKWRVRRMMRPNGAPYTDRSNPTSRTSIRSK